MFKRLIPSRRTSALHRARFGRAHGNGRDNPGTRVMAKGHRPRSGYTLVEMLVSLASSTILIAGMGGSIFIASLAFDETASQPSQVLAASKAADAIMYEARYATRFYERTSNAVTFGIPDENGDGSEEIIRYAWSGVPGDPLTMELNGSTPSVLLAGVRNLDLRFMTRTVTAPPPPPVPVGVVYEEFTENKMGTQNTTIVLSTPGGTADGDLLIAALCIDSDVASTLSPSSPGWTQVAVRKESGGSVTLGVWWKLADPVESPNHSYTWAGSKQAYGWMMRFTGHDSGTPIDTSAVADQGNSWSPGSPAVTTAVANAMILRLGGFDDDDITLDQPGLSGHTPITMGESGTGNSSASGGAGYVEQPSVGDSGTSTFSLTGNEQSVTVTIAIAPAP